MINKIIGTIGTRVYVGVILLIILGLHSKNLGAEILGKLAIFRLALTINHLFSSVFSGPIVYVGNRISINKLVLPTITWIIVCSILLSFIQLFFNLIESAQLVHLLLLSLLYSFQTFLEQVLLCKQKIKLFNISALLYHTILILMCVILIFCFSWKDENVFYFSMYGALIASNVFLFLYSYKFFNIKQFSFKLKIASILFSLGFWVQINNFIQTLNYRICLVFLDMYWGKKIVGYFSAALQLAEAIWIIAKSLATVQYAKIAATKSKEFAVDLTLLLSKISFFVSLFASILLLIIPKSALGYFLGKDFSNLNEILIYLMPGILLFSISLIYCHYFSGRGKFYFNTIGSLISLLIILYLAPVYLPHYGAIGAAAINSAGLLGMLLFNVSILLFVDKINPMRLIPTPNDFKRGFAIIKDYLK